MKGVLQNRGVGIFAALLVLVLAIPRIASADKITYYHNDLLGSPVAATNDTGLVIWHERYGPYGDRQLLEAASAKDNIWFTSRHEDEATELVYMGARYYDPVVGRFLAVDSQGFSENNVHSFNRYAYANNNVYKFVDPNGRDAVIVTQRDGTVRILIPINFSGPGATRGAIESIKNDISSRWSGAYDINGSITNVNVAVVEGPSHGVQNSIVLTTGATSNTDAQGASFVRGGRSGEWNINSPGMQSGEAAHEAGHLMHEGDYYTSSTNSEGKRVTTPRAGHQGNLMGQLPGTTNSENMRVIMRSSDNKRVAE